MPTINWEKGGTFSFGEGNYGVVLGPDSAVLITEEVGKSLGWNVQKGEIPADALPFRSDRMHYGAQMAIKGALAAVA